MLPWTELYSISWAELEKEIDRDRVKDGWKRLNYDLDPKLCDAGEAGNILIIDVHYTEKGNLLIGELFAQLIQEGLIKHPI